MPYSRRTFIRTLTVLGAGAALPCRTSQGSETTDSGHDDPMGVLVDIPKCIGCRRCEYACREAAGFNPPPLESFEDKSVFSQARRPHPGSHTVINRYEGAAPDAPIYNKFNCLHCLHPACVSACLVSALQRKPNGAVTYDPSRCMGCRYCMVACPFEIPTYEYDHALTPQVRKCNLCAHLVPDKQPVPACVKICPAEVMTYGRRSELLALAHDKIRREPQLYEDHVYGEHEAGGTAWLYIAQKPFTELGLKQVDSKAPPLRTETIQHGVFKHFLPPLMLYGLLGAAMWLTKPTETDAGDDDLAGAPPCT